MDKTFQILFTTDVHGKLFGDIGECSLNSAKEQLRKDGNTLLLDGGDLLQGGPEGEFLYEISKDGYAAADIINNLAYDACTIGNHDLNFGLSYYASFVKHINAAMICCNLIDRTGELLFVPHKIFTLQNGIRIGIIGATSPVLNDWECGEITRNIAVTPVLLSVKKAYQEIRDLCDVTVLIYHGGLNHDPETGEILGELQENLAEEIAKELPIDLILCGHQHRDFEKVYINHTHILETGKRIKTFSRITGLIQEEVKLSVSIETVNEESATDPVAAAFHAWGSPIVLRQSTPILVGGDRLTLAVNGSPLAAMAGNALRAATGAQISCIPLGDNLKDLPANACIEDLYRTFPTSGKLCVIAVTGSQLEEALEKNAAFVSFEDGKCVITSEYLYPNKQFHRLDFYTGLTFDTDYRKAVGERISNIRIGDEPVSPQGRYTMVLPYYRRGGGGGFDMLKSAPILVENVENIASILINHYSKSLIFT